MSKNILQVNIKDGDDELAILADFLRSGQITSRAIAALKAFYLSQSIAQSPNSTPEDIRKAEHYCLSQLKQQMCYIMDKHYRDDGIKMDADEFSTVTINQPAPSNLGLLPSLQLTSAPTPSPVIADLPDISIAKKDDEEIEEEDDEDEDDPYEGMSDEEYLEATKHLRTGVDIKI